MPHRRADNMFSLSIPHRSWRTVWAFYLHRLPRSPGWHTYLRGIYPFTGESQPVNAERWDALEWQPEWDDRPEPGPKPGWDEVIKHRAEYLRGLRVPQWLDALHSAYEVNLGEHVPGVRDQFHADRFIDMMTQFGQTAHANAAAAWQTHLFYRYLELRFSIERGDDETIIGIDLCGNLAGPELWEGATWRWCPSLPVFDKQGAPQGKLWDAPPEPPPSDFLVSRMDGEWLGVRSTAPAEVRLSDVTPDKPPLINPVSITFAGPDTKLVRIQAPEGQTPDSVSTVGRSIHGDWTAYGKTYSVTLPIDGAAWEGG